VIAWWHAALLCERRRPRDGPDRQCHL